MASVKLMADAIYGFRKDEGVKILVSMESKSF